MSIKKNRLKKFPIDLFLNTSLFFALATILTIKGDGFFPLDSDIDRKPLSLILGSLSFVIILNIFLIFKKYNFSPKKLDIKINYFQYVVTLIFVFNVLAIAVLTIKNLDSLGIRKEQSIVWVAWAASLVSFCWFMFTKKAKEVFFTVLITFVIFSIFQIYYFPITAKVSDLMPIILKQGDAFLKGESIYQFFLLDNGSFTQAVRQPGTFLFYLPSVIFGFDPRFLSLMYNLGVVAVLYKFFYKAKQKMVFDLRTIFFNLIITIFLLTPYKLIRSDLYDPPFWFLLSLSLYYVAKNKLNHFSFVWGIAIFTQVWAWIFTPFIFVYILKNNKLKLALFSCISSLSLGFGLLLAFILPDFESYKIHTIDFYSQTIKDGWWSETAIHLTPVMHVFKLKNFIYPFQIGFSAIVGLLSLKYMKTFGGLLFFLSLVFFVFIQFNAVTWNYMYLNLLPLFSIALLYRAKTS